MSALLRSAICLGLAGSALLPRGSAWAETAVRVGDHVGFSRGVFDLPPEASSNVVTEGNRVLLVFQGAGGVLEPAAIPRNVQTIQTGSDTATIKLVPGARARPVRLGNRLVVDIFDPARTATAKPRPRPMQPDERRPAPAEPVQPPASKAATPAPSPAVPRTAVLPDGAAPAPPALRPTLPSTPEPEVPPIPRPDPPRFLKPSTPDIVEAARSRSFTIQADSDVGAAAFRRGEFGIVVLDRRLPRQAILAGMSWTEGATTAVIQVPLALTAALRLSRGPAGWSVDVAESPPNRPMRIESGGNSLSVLLDRPGRMIRGLSDRAPGRHSHREA